MADKMVNHFSKISVKNISTVTFDGVLTVLHKKTLFESN